MKIPSPRIQILDKIDELQNEHCEECEFKTRGARGSNYCTPDFCLIAKRIKSLGEMLTDHKAESVKKPKTSNIKIFKKDVGAVNKKGLTKEIYQDLKAQGMSDKKIMDKYIVDNTSFYKLKSKWGLVNSPVKNKQSVEEKPAFKPQINKADNQELLEMSRGKIRSLEEQLQLVASERDDYKNKYIETFNNLEAMQGELNRIDKLRDRDAKTIQKLMINKQPKITLNNQPKECDCTSDKLTELQSELALADKEKIYLIDHINSINKYKDLYFKTAETLKLHLPN